MKMNKKSMREHPLHGNPKEQISKREDAPHDESEGAMKEKMKRAKKSNPFKKVMDKHGKN